jgi:hypothetical protein
MGFFCRRVAFSGEMGICSGFFKGFFGLIRNVGRTARNVGRTAHSMVKKQSLMVKIQMSMRGTRLAIAAVSSCQDSR